MKKTFKIIMLPTEKESDIHLAYNKHLYKSVEPFIQKDKETYQSQHIYIISDEGVKEGDWFLSAFGSYPLHNVKGGYNEYGSDLSGFKRIIASTDKSLKFGEDCEPFVRFKYLPSIPESFINAYIKAYNDGKPITEVDLEFDCDHAQMPNKVIDIIKTLPDGTVIVHQSKMYSLHQVVKAMDKAHQEGLLYGQNSSYKSDLIDYYEWIEKNL